MAKSNNSTNSNNSRRSHRVIFLYFIVFIALTGSLLGLFSEYFNNKSLLSVDFENRLAGQETKQEEALQNQSEAAASVDINHDPLLHAKQEQLKVYFNQSVIMLHAKKYQLSIVALHKVLEIDPKMPEAHTNMGFSLLGLKKFGASRDFFLTALALDDSQLNAFYGLALSHAELLEYQSAIGAIVSYIHLSPDNEPYVNSAHKKLQTWRQAVSEQEEKQAPSEG